MSRLTQHLRYSCISHLINVQCIYETDTLSRLFPLLILINLYRIVIILYISNVRARPFSHYMRAQAQKNMRAAQRAIELKANLLK